MTLGTNDKLFERGMFVVRVGEPVNIKDYDGNIYQVVNTHTDVIEMEASTLATAIIGAKTLDHRLDEAIKAELEDEDTPAGDTSPDRILQ
jgi:hypothetical protein